ncbi:MAG: lysophospholipid acyltransferase family protein [Tetrasphaera sp.]
MWYWFFKFVALGPIARWYLRLRWIGRENLPRRGPFVVASNHLTYLDPVGISVGVPHKVIYVAKQKYFGGTGFAGRALSWFLTAIGQVPIDTRSKDTADPAMDTARRILADGGVVAIFPEGTRSPDGKLYRGRTGAARLTLPTRVPLIPAGVIGTREVRLPLQSNPRRGRVTVSYGRPLDLSPWYGREDDPQAWREVTDLLMTQIAALSGQERDDRYPTATELAGRTETWLSHDDPGGSQPAP